MGTANTFSFTAMHTSACRRSIVRFAMLLLMVILAQGVAKPASADVIKGGPFEIPTPWGPVVVQTEYDTDTRVLTVNVDYLTFHGKHELEQVTKHGTRSWFHDEGKLSAAGATFHRYEYYVVVDERQGALGAKGRAGLVNPFNEHTEWSSWETVGNWEEMPTQPSQEEITYALTLDSTKGEVSVYQVIQDGDAVKLKDDRAVWEKQHTAYKGRDVCSVFSFNGITYALTLDSTKGEVSVYQVIQDGDAVKLKDDRAVWEKQHTAYKGRDVCSVFSFNGMTYALTLDSTKGEVSVYQVIQDGDAVKLKDDRAVWEKQHTAYKGRDVCSVFSFNGMTYALTLDSTKGEVSVYQVIQDGDAVKLKDDRAVWEKQHTAYKGRDVCSVFSFNGITYALTLDSTKGEVSVYQVIQDGDAVKLKDDRAVWEKQHTAYKGRDVCSVFSFK